MYKKIFLSLVLMVVLSCTYFIASGYSQTELEKAQFIASKWIIQSYKNPYSYRLWDYITRKETMKIILNLAWLTVPEICKWKFKDVSADWWCKYIEKALLEWLITNKSAYFRPNDNITKIEVIKLILKAKSVEKTQNTSNWQSDYMETAYKHWIIDKKFYDYNSIVTRSWIFYAIANTFNNSSSDSNDSNPSNKCWDWVCDSLEKSDSTLCPSDCNNNQSNEDDNTSAIDDTNSNSDTSDSDNIDIDSLLGIDSDSDNTANGDWKFGFLATFWQEVAALYNTWDESLNLDLISESNKLVSDLKISWSRELSFMYKNTKTYSSLSTYSSEKINTAKDANLNIMATILIDWTISSQSDYKTWLTSVITNNKSSIKYWQIHNEVWKKNRYEDSSDYVELVKISSPIIKSVCSDCQVIMWSTIPEQEYYEYIINNADSYVDAYDFHIFWEDEISEFSKFVSAVNNKNSSKPIFVTEMATHSWDPSWSIFWNQTESDQAKTLIKWYTETFSVWADYIFWNELIEWYKFAWSVDWLFDLTWLVYNWMCSSSSTNDVCNDTSKDKWALVKKESYYSLKTLINKIDWFTSVTKLKDWQYKFSFSSKNPVYIAWCDSSSCTLSSSISWDVTLTDYQWNSESSNASEIKLTSSPVFIESK